MKIVRLEHGGLTMGNGNFRKNLETRFMILETPFRPRGEKIFIAYLDRHGIFKKMIRVI